MSKYVCIALVATACAAAVPAAHADGAFFVAGQVGQATYDDWEGGDDSASTRALSGGYRWQAGPIIQVGVEGGLGEIDEVTMGYYYSGGGYVGTGSVAIDTSYLHVGANARFAFGEGSRWFAIARAGYVAYEMDGRGWYETRYNGTLMDSGGGSSSEDGGGAYFGGGLGVDITRNFSVNAMYNGFAYSNFREDFNGELEVGTASTTTLGVEVRF